MRGAKPSSGLVHLHKSFVEFHFGGRPLPQTVSVQATVDGVVLGTILPGQVYATNSSQDHWLLGLQYVFKAYKDPVVTQVEMPSENLVAVAIASQGLHEKFSSEDPARQAELQQALEEGALKYAQAAVLRKEGRLQITGSNLNIPKKLLRAQWPELLDLQAPHDVQAHVFVDDPHKYIACAARITLTKAKSEPVFYLSGLSQLLKAYLGAAVSLELAPTDQVVKVMIDTDKHRASSNTVPQQMGRTGSTAAAATAAAGGTVGGSSSTAGSSMRGERSGSRGAHPAAQPGSGGAPQPRVAAGQTGSHSAGGTTSHSYQQQQYQYQQQHHHQQQQQQPGQQFPLSSSRSAAAAAAAGQRGRQIPPLPQQQQQQQVAAGLSAGDARCSSSRVGPGAAAAALDPADINMADSEAPAACCSSSNLGTSAAAAGGASSSRGPSGSQEGGLMLLADHAAKLQALSSSGHLSADAAAAAAAASAAAAAAARSSMRHQQYQQQQQLPVSGCYPPAAGPPASSSAAAYRPEEYYFNPAAAAAAASSMEYGAYSAAYQQQHPDGQQHQASAKRRRVSAPHELDLSCIHPGALTPPAAYSPSFNQEPNRLPVSNRGRRATSVGPQQQQQQQPPYNQQQQQPGYNQHPVGQLPASRQHPPHNKHLQGQDIPCSMRVSPTAVADAAAPAAGFTAGGPPVGTWLHHELPSDAFMAEFAAAEGAGGDQQPASLLLSRQQDAQVDAGGAVALVQRVSSSPLRASPKLNPEDPQHPERIRSAGLQQQQRQQQGEMHKQQHGQQQQQVGPGTGRGGSRGPDDTAVTQRDQQQQQQQLRQQRAAQSSSPGPYGHPAVQQHQQHQQQQLLYPSAGGFGGYPSPSPPPLMQQQQGWGHGMPLHQQGHSHGYKPSLPGGHHQQYHPHGSFQPGITPPPGYFPAPGVPPQVPPGPYPYLGPGPGMDPGYGPGPAKRPSGHHHAPCPAPPGYSVLPGGGLGPSSGGLGPSSGAEWQLPPSMQLNSPNSCASSFSRMAGVGAAGGGSSSSPMLLAHNGGTGMGPHLGPGGQGLAPGPGPGEGGPSRVQQHLGGPGGFHSGPPGMHMVNLPPGSAAAFGQGPPEGMMLPGFFPQPGGLQHSYPTGSMQHCVGGVAGLSGGPSSQGISSSGGFRIPTVSLGRGGEVRELAQQQMNLMMQGDGPSALQRQHSQASVQHSGSSLPHLGAAFGPPRLTRPGVGGSRSAVTAAADASDTPAAAAAAGHQDAGQQQQQQAGERCTIERQQSSNVPGASRPGESASAGLQPAGSAAAAAAAAAIAADGGVDSRMGPAGVDAAATVAAVAAADWPELAEAADLLAVGKGLLQVMNLLGAGSEARLAVTRSLRSMSPQDREWLLSITYTHLVDSYRRRSVHEMCLILNEIAGAPHFSVPTAQAAAPAAVLSLGDPPALAVPLAGDAAPAGEAAGAAAVECVSAGQAAG